jgi:hypothetical protein
MIGEELGAKMKAASDPSRVWDEWTERVRAEFDRNGNVFTPELCVLFSELLPYAAEEENVARSLMKAEIVLWDEVIYQAASAGHECMAGDLPPDFSSLSPQIWFRSQVLETPEGEHLYGVFVFPILSMYHDPQNPARGIQVCDIRGIPGKGLTVIGTESVIVEGHPVDEGDSHILAMYLFLRQEWVEARPVQFPRSFRRRYEREKKPVPEVRTVILRRSAVNGETDEERAENEAEGKREYSCQWIVSGHWRRQFYPSTGEHKPIYIAPHPKGPTDKPLRAPRPTVYVAKR